MLGKKYKTFSRPEHDRWRQPEHDKKESVLWYGRYVVVFTTTTCWQLGNDTTYDTEKKNPTSHDVADTSAVSGRCVGKTRRHVFKTNCGRHLKRRHFQLSTPVSSGSREALDREYWSNLSKCQCMRGREKRCLALPSSPASERACSHRWLRTVCVPCCNRQC